MWREHPWWLVLLWTWQEILSTHREVWVECDLQYYMQWVSVSTIVLTWPHYYSIQGCPLGEKYCEIKEECASTHTPDTECCHTNRSYCSNHDSCMPSTLSDEECGKECVILYSPYYTVISRLPGRGEVLCRRGTMFTTRHWGQCVLWARFVLHANWQVWTFWTVFWSLWWDIFYSEYMRTL